MNNIYHKIITGGFALVLAGAVAFTAAPMDAQASAALGISSQIGLSADMDAAETTDVENAMNQTVLDAFHLDGYSNLGIVTVSEGKVNIRDSASTEGKIVGKIGNNAGCDVLGEEGEWLQIKSGKVEGYIKLQIPAGKATPAPPVGPALGQHGVNIVEFTKQFNARTADKGDVIIPVVITVYADRSFSFITKTPPAAVLLKKACNLKSASAVPNKTKVATISKDKVREIAELKMPDLNAASIESAMSMIAGTARSMGIVVED